jgi:glycosyltransferase involved in cell wall biosynthesis
MADPITVSVVTPCLNPGKHLAATIQSVLSQDYPHIEYMVMDAGSTDGTLDLLRSFGDRLRWISEADRGQADAINKGFSGTKGQVLAWLNADDTYAPGAIRAAMEFLTEHTDVDMVYGNADFIDADGKLIGPCAHIEPFSRNRLIHYSDFIVQPAAFFRRSAFEAVGGLDVNLHWSMDYDLWIKLSERHTIQYLPRTLANYRWLGASKTASGGWKRLDEIRSVLRRHGFDTPAYVRLECINALMGEAMESCTAGKIFRALDMVGRAAGTLLVSPRAIISLFSLHTWRIIYMGQVLRKRAAGSKSE